MRSLWVAASSTILSALLLAGCGGHVRVAVTVTPSVSAWDAPIDVRVTGLSADRAVTIGMSSTDVRGIRFASSLALPANRHGIVDLAASRAWPMGLFVSMKPAAGGISLYYWGSQPRRFRVKVSAGGRTLATTVFRRGFGYPAPIAGRALTVAREGIVGSYFAPAHARREPAVLVFGGSEGGPGHPLDAVRFASDGIPALALGYFHAPGVPSTLEDVPLEYFRRALEWLDRQPGVDPRRVTVIGASRGGEAALLLGVHYPSLVHGVVSLVGSDYVVCGIVGAGTESGCTGPAWTLHGKPLPYLVPGNPNPAARIPVARIRAPVLLTCAEDDQVWPSCVYQRQAEQELDAAHFRYPHPLYAFPGVGHFGAQIGAYEPGALLEDVFVPQDEQARERLWPKILAFVRNA